MPLNITDINNSQQNAKTGLRYSIISSDEEENPLKLKLKVSEKQFQNLSVTEVSPRVTSRRRTRNKLFKDYEIEIVSPMKKINISRTPTKRNLNSPINKVTPSKKQTLEPLPKKNGVRTPLTFEANDKRNLRVNLDESFRRSVLKCHLNLDQITREPSSDKMNNTRVLRSRRVTRQYYDDSESDEKKSTDIKKSETLSKVNDTSSDYSSSDEYRSCAKSEAKSLCKKSNSTISLDSDEEKIKILPRKRKVSNVEYTPRKDTRRSLARTPKTPKNRAKLIRDGIVTPSMHERSQKIGFGTKSTPLMKARSQLHISFVPDALPCREKEYHDIYGFLEGKLKEECGGCMYISGVPGTGKTATVTSVISNLQKCKSMPKFDYVNINGMRLTEPRQAYVEIIKQLTGKTLPWEQAQNMLEERFTKKKNTKSVVMLIDELDILCTRRQDVVYNLLDWPGRATEGRLVAVAVANTMDLPERLLARKVASRLGLTRLPFAPYTYRQLQQIVEQRLAGVGGFHPDAMQLVARKVASVSGDARRALDICRRAAEIAEAEEKTQLVTLSHVDEALNAMMTQPKVQAIRNCSKLEQLLLQAIVAEVERTGVEETTFADVYKMLVSCCALDGFEMVSTTVALAAISRLGVCRLILIDQKHTDILQKIILNVNSDDIYLALKQDV